MNILRALVYIVVFSCSFGIYSSVSHAQSQISKITESVVYIEIKDKNGNRKEHGSGILIGLDGYIITAQHILNDYNEGEDSINVSLKARVAPAFRARKIDCTPSLLDVCLLYVTSQAIRVANITSRIGLLCSMPTLGMGITAVGYPVGDDNSLVMIPGIVAAEGLGSLAKIVMSNAVIPGMSGGPIFNSNYDVVGLVWGRDANLGVPLFTPLMHGRTLLGMANIDCPSTIASNVNGTLAGTLSTTNSSTLTIPSQIARADSKAVSDIFASASKALTEEVRKAEAKPTTTSRIFVQISNENQREAAGNLIKKLDANGLNVAKGIDEERGLPPLGGPVLI